MTEHEAIKNIEKQIGSELPIIDYNQIIIENFDKNQQGYSINAQNQVIGLSLFSNSTITNLSFLDELRHLQTLNLCGTNILDIKPLRYLKKLTKLDLSATKIQDYTPLGSLITLTQLDLSNTKISNLEPIKNLTKLIKLYLSLTYITEISLLEHLCLIEKLTFNGVNITDIHPLQKLPRLVELDLSATDTSDITPLQNHNQLTNLNLHGTHIIDLSPLQNSTELTQIDLSHTQITNLSPLQNFTKLAHINLSHTKITDLNPLQNSTKLTHINLSHTKITDLNPLQNSTKLTHINLSHTKITDLSPLQNSTELTQIDLSHNKITDLSPLQNLTKITQIDLSYTNIENLAPIQNITQLTKLNLHRTNVSDLTVLQKLTDLTQLFLKFTYIQDITPLKYLKQLRQLDLSVTKVKDLTPLQDLTQLTSIHINYTAIEDLTPLTNLRNLRSINASRTPIKKLSPQILNLDLDFQFEEHFYSYKEGINLYETPLESPPIEIVKQGREAVAEYFRSLEGEERQLNEVKVLLVGEGGAGKTSLVRQLLGEDFDEEESQTHGINIRNWQVEDVRVRLWDFGGQEIMHATHQFFLSKRSLYVLVLDVRKEDRTEYWLKHIEAFGGESRILVVLNKIDENPGFQVNQSFLKDKYPNIVNFYRISCAEGDGLQELENALRQELPHVEMVSSRWPQSWFTVKTTLEENKRPYINYTEFNGICQNAGVTETKTQEVLATYLHDLGVALHFPDIELDDTHVLEPEWATQGVYKIINSAELANSKGVLHLDDLQTILAPQNKDDFDYTGKHRYIIELMKKFELCYELNVTNTVLVPDLLDVEEQPHDFGIERTLRFYFEYDFLPPSIMPRFIVQTHADIKGEQRWRTGVVLQDDDLDAIAEIKSDREEKRIYIEVGGTQKRDYFATLRKTLRNIHNSFEHLDVAEWIPLPDSENHAVEYAELIGHERDNRHEYYNGKLRRAFPVAELLDGIEDPRDRREKYDHFGDHDPRDLKHERIVVPPAQVTVVHETPQPSKQQIVEPKQNEQKTPSNSILSKVIVGVGVIASIVTILLFFTEILGYKIRLISESNTQQTEINAPQTQPDSTATATTDSLTQPTPTRPDTTAP